MLPGRFRGPGYVVRAGQGPLFMPGGRLLDDSECRGPAARYWVGMSEENLERIRAGFAAHNRGDLDALVELYDPEVVFETLLLGTHHGNEAIRLIYEENQKTLSGYAVEPVELIDSGDQVVAVAEVKGVGPVSQIAMDGDQFAFLFTIRNGRVVREQAFRNRDEALEAAGLRE